MLEIQISNFPATSHECLAMNYESFLSVHLSTSPKSVYSFLSVGQRDNPPLSLCSKGLSETLLQMVDLKITTRRLNMQRISTVSLIIGRELTPLRATGTAQNVIGATTNKHFRRPERARETCFVVLSRFLKNTENHVSRFI